MDGSWRIFAAGERWSGGPAHQIRAILANAGHTAVGYRLPVLELLRTRDETKAVGHLGPDLLAPDWDAEFALRNLLSDPARPLGEALLDQRNLAGVGNVFKSEICFALRVVPWLPIGNCPPRSAWWPPRSGSLRPTRTGRCARHTSTAGRTGRARAAAPPSAPPWNATLGPRAPHLLVPHVPALPHVVTRDDSLWSARNRGDGSPWAARNRGDGPPWATRRGATARPGPLGAGRRPAPGSSEPGRQFPPGPLGPARRSALMTRTARDPHGY